MKKHIHKVRLQIPNTAEQKKNLKAFWEKHREDLPEPIWFLKDGVTYLGKKTGRCYEGYSIARIAFGHPEKREVFFDATTLPIPPDSPA